MKLILKIVLGVAGVALLLFVVLVVAVTVIIEPNDYRPYIVDAVRDSTGRDFELQGDLGLKVLPCCSVSLGASRLGSPAGFPEDAFASLASASLSLKIWPLIARREVEIGTVTLDGLDLTLVRLADGRVNWEFESAEAPSAGAPPSESTPIGLSVNRVVLRNGQVRYRDLESGQDYTAADLQLDTRLAMSGDRVTVADPALSLTATGTALPDPLTVDMAADTLVATLDDAAEVSIDAFTIDLRTLESTLRLTGAGRAGTALALQGDFALRETSPRRLLAALSDDPYQPADGSALTRLAAQGRWTLGTSSLTVQDLAVQLDDSSLTGTVAVEDFATAASRFDLALDRIDLDRYLAAADPAAPGAASGASEPTEIPLNALAELPVDGALRIGTLRGSGVDLNDVAITFGSRGGRVSTSLTARGLGGGVKLDGSGNVAGAEPQIAGTITVETVSPRALLTALDATVDTADPAVLQRFAGTAGWRLTPRAAALNDMRWRLDDSTLTGTARVDDFDTLATRFDLTLDRMNVDAYLPPEHPEAAPAEADAEIIPVEAIRDLNLEGRLRAGELVLLGMTLRDVAAQVRAAGGVLRLDPMTAALYGGTYQGTAIIDATGPRANLTLDQQLAAVQVNDILKTFFDSDLLGGSLSFKLTGSGAGNTTDDLLRGLAADVSFDLSDGVYRGMDVLYQVRRARALLKNEPAPEAPAQAVTPIRTLKATGRMADGVLQTNQLSAETDALRLLGSGGVNLMALALDYDLKAEVLSAGAAAAKLGDLANATIPLTISGPLSAPKIGVDMKGLITSTVRETVQQKARSALLEKLGGAAEEPGGGSGTAESDTGASAGGTAGGAADAAPEAEPGTEPAPEPSARDLLKRGLRDLLKPKDKASDGDSG